MPDKKEDPLVELSKEYKERYKNGDSDGSDKIKQEIDIDLNLLEEESRKK